MCGIAGLFDPRASDRSEVRADCLAMTKVLHHRGPDDGDVWIDGDAGIALGHRRLAVVDLSAAGRQPMSSANQRWMIVYNGEIYNHVQIAAQLNAGGVQLRGGSDTEVLLEAISLWGVDKAIARCNGMFAFAVWDREQCDLWLARDRLGEKPLYYSCAQGRILFASELKGLHASNRFHAVINRETLALYLRYGRVPGSACIFDSVQQLRAGCLVKLVSNAQVVSAQAQSYWSLGDVAQRGVESSNGTQATPELLDEAHERVRSAVTMRMQADVPLGAFLSGGIDSSLIVAMMQAHDSRAVRTFSVGFDDADYDESYYARAVATHLGTKHTQVQLSSDEGLKLVPRLAEIYDEPFADSSQIPTLLISEVARREVTVCLSGDGGDELFGGYNHYQFGEVLWQRLRYLPPRLAKLLQGLMYAVPYRYRSAAVRGLASVLPYGRRVANPERKLERLLGLLGVQSREQLYFNLVRGFGAHDVSQAQAANTEAWFEQSVAWPKISNFGAWMMAMDTVTYLPDDILTKVDRASMAVSLEGRIPFLDHTLVEFAWSLPLDSKVNPSAGKWILRKLLQRYLPQALIDRPKMGFAVPLDRWLRGPLREWAEDLFASRALDCEGLVDTKAARRALDDHLSGRRNHPHLLWTLLMFIAWRERWQV
jgi:asparagine synthase (glutamine-hydrolysing)